MKGDKHYDEIANEYKESKELSFRKVVEKYSINLMLGNIEGKDILDLACGEGIYSRMMKNEGAKSVFGVDISHEMIELAKKAEKENPIGCSYEVNDVFDFKPKKEFDIVTGFYLLNYAQTREDLKKMCQVLFNSIKKGGKFIGFNDNPMNKKENYGSYRKYGFIKETTPEREEGAFIKYTMFNHGEDGFTFNNYYLSEKTYEEVFKEVGFQNFKWVEGKLDPKEKGNPFWDDFMKDQPFIGMTAEKI
ncbi:class I SAM-dependent methyltransferase [Aureivirga sp. CE67]|uniref:class I SAM-dependent methyltransferase n=1 Tax=Aureivirga sp. CE67 TaxID=1788983 RepID=UPI0018CA6BCC|nr:class I SAM-dependent methyltransferase [Aureivirga sp. CE67]